MAFVQQKKLNKNFILTLIVMVALIGIAITELDIWVKLGSTVVIILVFLMLRRGYIFFAQGVSLMKMDDENPVVAKRFRRAIRANVGPEQQVFIGSYFIHKCDDYEFGISLLEKLSHDSNPNISNYAKVSLSMGYNRRGELDKAVDILMEVLESGYKDKNLYVNLTTYLLEMGKPKEAKKYLNQAKDLHVNNDAVNDNKGWLSILSGEWDKALKIYDDLINDSVANFPDAYVHSALVFLHFGKKEDALNCLGWGKALHFSKICPFTKEYIDRLMLGIENPEVSDAFVEAVNANTALVACGKDFEGFELARKFDGPRYEVADHITKYELENVKRNIMAADDLDDDDDDDATN